MGLSLITFLLPFAACQAPRFRPVAEVAFPFRPDRCDARHRLVIVLVKMSLSICCGLMIPRPRLWFRHIRVSSQHLYRLRLRIVGHDVIDGVVGVPWPVRLPRMSVVIDAIVIDAIVIDAIVIVRRRRIVAAIRKNMQRAVGHMTRFGFLGRTRHVWAVFGVGRGLV